MSFELKEVINNQNCLLQSDSVRNGGVTKTVIFLFNLKKNQETVLLVLKITKPNFLISKCFGEK